MLQNNNNYPVGASNRDLVAQPYLYLSKHPGKDLRSKFIASFEHWITMDPTQTRMIQQVISMLHTSSLLLDDIEDDSELRRSVTAAHKLYGVPGTINCANYVCFEALETLLRLPDTLALGCARIYNVEMIQLHVGQGMDIYWRDNSICPSLEQYQEMVLNKTGGLLRMAVKLMQLCGNASIDYVPLVNLVSIHFQIRDDLLNLTSNQYNAQKGFAEDLTEGKFSYPIIHFLTHFPEHCDSVIALLKSKTKDPLVKADLVALMNKSGTFEAVKIVLKSYEEGIRDMIASHGGNPSLESIVDYLSNL